MTAAVLQEGGLPVDLFRRSNHVSGVTPGGVRYLTIPARERPYASRITAHAGRDWLERAPLSHFPSNHRIARGLAAALVAGPWQFEHLVERGTHVLGRRPRWLSPTVHRILKSFSDGSRPTSARLSAFLTLDRGFVAACSRGLRLPTILPQPPVMWPTPGRPTEWDVPPITTVGELARHLDISPPELDGYADLQGRVRRAPAGPLRHYRYRWQGKVSGSPRLIESPKSRLKSIQRRILDEILSRIPPHDMAHGFRAGRSIRTYAEPHTERAVVLKLDLSDFFPTVSAARVVAIFLTAGYPELVSRRLAGLCTGRVPHEVWSLPGSPGRESENEAWRLRKLYQAPHLPQGAPTSPALANLCAFRFDTRLAALAAEAGARYTRYADDLAFSGDSEFARSVDRFSIHVGAVAIEEGFRVNPRKTRIMRQSDRQRLAGVVVNRHPNIQREEFDRLKAILHNCRTHGPSDQNRDGHPDFRAHLTGRAAHLAMLNPERGRKIRAILDAIDWNR